VRSWHLSAVACHFATALSLLRGKSIFRLQAGH
jgi:hypothetical protein